MNKKSESISHEEVVVSNSHNKLYLWLFLLTIFVFILGFYFFNGKVTKQGADSSYVNAIIAISGFLAAFSAISIYSIFNANVDRQREEIEQLTNKLKSQVRKFKKSDKEISELLNNTIMIIQLILPHSGERPKREAIRQLSIIPFEEINQNNKETIFNFYNSLDEEEKGKKYYQELEKLLISWEMISPQG